MGPSLEAMGYAAAGIRPPRPAGEARSSDGRRSETCGGRPNPDAGAREQLCRQSQGAKTAATRTARIAKFRDGILAGKGCDGTVRCSVNGMDVARQPRPGLAFKERPLR
jgi:hypothetical protein